MTLKDLQDLITRAEQAKQKGNFEEAERLANSILEALKIPNLSNEIFEMSAYLRAKALLSIADSESRRGNYYSALTGAKEVEKEAEKHSLNELLPIARNLIGNSYFYLAEFESAIEVFTKTINRSEEDGDELVLSKALGNLGNIYASLKNYEKAIEYYTKHLKLTEKIGDTLGMVTCLTNIGNAYSNLDNYEEAFKFFNKALSADKDFGNNSLEANIKASLGRTHYHLGNLEEALEFFLQASSILEKTGDKLGQAYINGYMGVLYSNPEFKDYDVIKAETYLLNALQLSRQTGAKNQESGILSDLSKLYKAENRWEECHQYFEQFHNLEKEVRSEEAKNKADQYEQQKQAAEREKEIEIAKAESAARMNATTALLHRVLPESISTRMINGEENISDFFPSVSILFADIQGFTAISANMKAIDVVRFLNYIFGEFDRIMKAHGCEKIKTIGDGYMAVAGAPIECEDHAERLAAAALEMQKTLRLPEDIRQTMPTESKFGIRIGIHTGSVVAGVIGEERFVYDIHSDAVNLASRMESSGEVGRVHVSSDFAEHLQARFKQTKNSKHGMHFEDRGETNIKGKGMMKTYFLERN